MSIEQQKIQQASPLHICITGSSQGIGLVAAQRLVQQGHIVYHACRNKGRAQAAAKAAGGGIPMVCNLADLDSVKKFATDLSKTAPTLNVLCLNAGIAPSTQSGTVPKRTKQGFEECIGVNHLGHFLLAQLLYPKLCESRNEKGRPDGRLVITASSVHDPEAPGGTSGGGQGATLGDLSGLGEKLDGAQRPTMVDGTIEYNGGKVYKDSKLCNILMCQAAVHKFPKCTSLCFNPGLVPTTGLFASLRGENWFKAQALTFFATMMGVAVPVQVAGDRLVYMATADVVTSSDSATSAGVKLVSGDYYNAPSKSHSITPADGFAPCKISKEASNTLLSELLWEKSLHILNDWL